MPAMSAISERLYTAEAVRRLDAAAMRAEGIEGYTLMCRAGQAMVDAARAVFPDARRWLVFCGAGNNAGDGYVIARLGRALGLDVRVVAVVDPGRLAGAAGQAVTDWRAAGGETTEWAGELPDAELVIDALLGTGLDRPVAGPWRELIEAANALHAPRLAVDIPSGLCADTGTVLGAAIRADLTVTVIGIKRGLLTADGPDHVGRLVFDDLEVSRAVHDAIGTDQDLHRATGGDPAGQRIDRGLLARALAPRALNTHKGTFGDVCIVGGNVGMGGATRLAGEGALRAGAGRVTVATHPEHARWLNMARPELMTCAVEGAGRLPAAALAADVVAVGPGLGRDGWARSLLVECMALSGKQVVDADALNLLATMGDDIALPEKGSWIITPHPAEAARLLRTETRAVQADRFAAASNLAQQFGAVTVLKGCGTVVAHPDGAWAVCPLGNPGMATAGAGDVLTGVCAAMLAQGLDAWAAARCAVVAHAAAGDTAVGPGRRGLLATDICDALPGVFDG